MWNDSFVLLLPFIIFITPSFSLSKAPNSSPFKRCCSNFQLAYYYTHTHTHTQSTLDVFWFLLSSFHVKYLSSIYGQCDHQTYYFWITLCNIITPLQMKKSKQGWIFSCSRQNFVDFWMEPRLISLHCQCFALPFLSSHHFCHCILIIDAKIIAEFDIAEVRWLD